MSMDLSLFSEDSNIHSQFATQAPIVAILIKKFYGNKPKVSFTFHAYDIYFKNLWFPFLVRESIGAFSISEYNVKYVKDHFGTEEKILLSRLGVFRRSPSQRSASGPRGNKIFTLGLLSWFTEKKGIKYLLEALKMLEEEGEVKVRLLLAGDGPMRESLIAYVEDNNLKGTVEFVGIVNKNEKPDFFNQIDAFVMPSIRLKNDQDGIPVVIMEALDFGLPIISTRVSGIPEICKDEFNGKLLPQRNSKALARAISEMASDPEGREKYGRNSLILSEEYDIVKNSNRKMQAIGWK
jgi:glycosyltransferase involved in cell wall biosynthesis